jgi:uncharacterized membrane protein YvbJ
MFCKKCGEQIDDNNAQFCSKCGQAVNEPKQQESKSTTSKQPTTADKVEGGVQGIILIVAIIMIIVAISALLGTCE